MMKSVNKNKISHGFYLQGYCKPSLMDCLSSVEEATKSMSVWPRRLNILSIVDKTKEGLYCYALDTAHASILDLADGYYAKSESSTKRGLISFNCLYKQGFSEADIEEIKRNGFLLQYNDNQGKAFTYIVDEIALSQLGAVTGAGDLKCGANSARDLYLAASLHKTRGFFCTVRTEHKAGRLLSVSKSVLRPSPRQAVEEVLKYLPLTVRKWEVTQGITRVFLQENASLSIPLKDNTISFGQCFEVDERNAECISIQNVLYYDGKMTQFSKKIHQIASMETSVARLVKKYQDHEHSALLDAVMVLREAKEIFVEDRGRVMEKLIEFLDLEVKFGRKNLDNLMVRLKNEKDKSSTMADVILSMVLLPAYTDASFKPYAIEKLRMQVSKLLQPSCFSKEIKEIRD